MMLLAGALALTVLVLVLAGVLPVSVLFGE